MRVLLMLLLTGCSTATPYVAARHWSDPSIENDGYDVACAGLKNVDRLSLKAGWCKNIRGGDMVELSVEYEFINVRK